MEAIIFDMDGVLADTPKYNWKSFNEILGRNNVSVSDDEIKKYLGLTLKDQLDEIKKDFDIKEEIDFEDFKRETTEIQFRLFEENFSPDDVILGIVADAEEAGIKLAVATSSTKIRAHKILELIGLVDKMDVILTAEDVSKHKPDPEAFLKTAEKLNVDARKCVVFEDSPVGINAARNAGMKVVAVKTDYIDDSELEEADLVISDFSEVSIDILRGLFG